MYYAQKTLLPGEKILFFTRPSPVLFYPIFSWGILGLFLFAFGSIYRTLSILAFLMAALSLISASISYYCSEYVVTDKRLLMKVGFISRNSLEIFNHRVEGIFVSQSVFGRIFNFGTVTIAGIGGTKNAFPYIPDPINFRARAQTEIEKATKVL